MDKTIYFYWGSQKLSFLRYMTLYSCRIMNPTLKIVLIKNNEHSNSAPRWSTSEKQDITEYKGNDYLDKLDELNIEIEELDYDYFLKIDKHMSEVHIKDILNWKILAQRGGMVADMDILFTAPLDSFFKSIEKADIALSCFDYNVKNYIPVSFMAGSSNNRFFKDVLSNAINKYNHKVYECAGTKCIKQKTLSAVRKEYPELKTVRIPETVVFPFNPHYAKHLCMGLYYNEDNTSLFADDTIGLHWYAGNPDSQRWNGTITKKNYKEHNNTLCGCLKKIFKKEKDNARITTT